MKVQVFSDLARSFIAQAQARDIKSAQSQMTAELTSGQTSDPIEHLRGDVTLLSDITQRNSLAKQYLQSNTEIGHMLDVAQTALNGMQDSMARFSDTLVVASQNSQPFAPDLIGLEAETAFSSIVRQLNASFAGRQVFSGQATDRSPLPSPNEVKTLIMDALIGAADGAEIQTRLDDFFADGGAFQTAVYGGSDTSLEPVKTSETSSIEFQLRADDQAFRETLKAAALSIAASEHPGLSRGDQERLVEASLETTLVAKDGLYDLSSNVGFMQEQVEKSQTQVQAQISVTDIARTELLSVDPFETASRLEDLNTRLEFLYTITARARNLSFLEYMR